MQARNLAGMHCAAGARPRWLLVDAPVLTVKQSGESDHRFVDGHHAAFSLLCALETRVEHSKEGVYSLSVPRKRDSKMWGISSVLGRGSVVAFMAASTGRQCSYSTSTALSATQYLLRYDYIPDVLEKRAPFREGHLNLAKDLIAQGTCLSGGPTGNVGMEVPSGALFIFTTAEAAKHFVENDPYVSGGIVTGHSIEEWNVVVQKE